MKQVTKVKLIYVDTFSVYKWLREEFNMYPMDAKQLSQNGSIIDFYGNMDKAMKFYDYLYSCGTNSARLIIDFTYDTRGFVAGNCFKDENNI